MIKAFAALLVLSFLCADTICAFAQQFEYDDENQADADLRELLRADGLASGAAIYNRPPVNLSPDRVAIVVSDDASTAFLWQPGRRVTLHFDGGPSALFPKRVVGRFFGSTPAIVSPIDVSGAVPHMRILLSQLSSEFASADEVTISHEKTIPWSDSSKSWHVILANSPAATGTTRSRLGFRSVTVAGFIGTNPAPPRIIRIKNATTDNVTDAIRVLSLPVTSSGTETKLGPFRVPILLTDVDCIAFCSVSNVSSSTPGNQLLFRTGGKLYLAQPSGQLFELKTYQKDVIEARLEKVARDASLQPTSLQPLGELAWTMPLSTDDFDALLCLCVFTRSSLGDWFLHPRSYCISFFESVP